MSITSQECTVLSKKSFDCNKAISPTSSRTLQFSSTTRLVSSVRRLKHRLRAGDLALNSRFNGRSSKADYLLAWSIKRNVTKLWNSCEKHRELFLCTFFPICFLFFNSNKFFTF